MKDAQPSVPVAIIGMGCLFPKADNLRQFWSNVREGVDAITEVPATHWRPEDYFDADPKTPDKVYAKRGGFLDPLAFNPLEYGIAPNDLEATDTTQLLGLVAAKQALQDAGYGSERTFDRSRVSVILGVTGTLELVIPLGARLGHPIWRRALKEAGVPDEVANDVVERISNGYVGWQENSFPGLLGNVVAGRIANRLDLGGTNCVVDAACASSLSAVHLALLELANGRADMVVTGGMDTFNDVFMYTCFSKTPALSPTGNAKPFDVNADGTILGEGLGVVVLKRLADAERDGDKIYAVIKGIGSSSDGKGNAIYAPSPAGQTRALRRAYELAAVTPDTIELVEAHGTGTKAGDVAEATALAEVYRSAQPQGTWCALGSVKSQVGHTKAAAGAAGLIKAALALHHKTLPPTIKVQKPIEPLANGSPLYVNAGKRPWLSRHRHPRRAAVSAFGFGGSNFHCVLEEHDAAKQDVDWDGSVEIVAFSAATADELRKQVSAWPATQDWPAMQRAASQTRARFIPAAELRLVAIVDRARAGWETLRSQLEGLLAKQGTDKAWTTPDGVYFGRGPADGQLALLFPGQGSQYAGMLRDLACQFPPMLEVLAQANVAFGQGRPDGDDRRLSDFIYPPAAFGDEERSRQEAELRATDVAQPALGATSLGLVRTLASFGVEPDVVAGHSYGELTALCAAGRFDAPMLFQLSQLRGKLMAQGNGERGAMLAVHAGLDQVRTVLAEERLDLVIANKNAPSQVVLSGASQSVERAAEVFQHRGLGGKRLPVAAAFHSPFVADARAPFLDALEPCAFVPSAIHVFANTTGRAYPADPDEARQLLAGQLAKPVEFVDQIGNMHAAGARVFLEVGPGNKLTGLVGDILKGKPHVALAIDASAGKRSGVLDFARALAQLAALGRSVALTKWEDGPRPPATDKKPALSVPICGANYVKPRPKKPARPPMTTDRPREVPSEDPNRRTALPIRPEGVMTPTSRPPATGSSGEPSQVTRPPAIDGTLVAQALEASRANLAALQKLGEQTADLHRQFLAGQERSAQTFQTLFAQQQVLIQTALGTPPQLALQPAAPAMDASPFSPQRAVESAPPRRPFEPSALSPMGRGAEGEGSIRQPSPQKGEDERRASPSTGGGGTQRVHDTLVTIVAEKTGYPVEMLEAGMTLDSDLGIDSIKRVEILSALQEQLPQAPVIKPDHLGTLRTLGDIVAFLAGEPPAAPTSPTTSRAPVGLSTNKVQQVLLGVVAEKTGYPPEMLELDMALDSDLGIDSIKRVEILSTLQEQLPEAPVVKPEHLGTLRSLRQVAEFLAGGQAEGPPVEQSREAPRPASTSVHATPPAKSVGLSRYALQTVAIDETIERPGVALVEGAHLWVTDDGGELSQLIAQRLQTLGHLAEVVSPTSVLQEPPPGDLAGLVIVTPAQGMHDAFLEFAFRITQHVGQPLRSQAQSSMAIFATVSRLDGAFGLRADSASVLSGGLAGLTKTVQLEWPDVACKAIDLDEKLDDVEDAAIAVVDEMLTSGPIEVGIDAGGRRTLTLQRADLGAADCVNALTRDDVVVVSGGARGVTAAVAVTLAERSQATLVLLGRSPAPSGEPEWLCHLVDAASIKRALHQERGQLTPKQLDEECRRILANRELGANLEKIARAGSRVEYHSVDVRDGRAINAVLDDVRRRLGPITGVVHGAGVLADRRIEDKSLAQFQEVYATKVHGCRSLLDATRGDPLKFIGLFSSSTGRFGRVGQVDYAMANEVLNKTAQHERRQRPGCRVVAINWGPWDGGMVTPGLKKLFASEGMDVIPLQAGAELFLREVAQRPDAPAEVVVVAGELPTVATVAEEQPSKGNVENVGPAAGLKPSFERVISIDEAPVLKAHVLDGHAVVPLVLSMEWLAHAALHQHPGMIFQGWEDVRVLKGILLSAEDKVDIQALAGPAVKQDGSLVVPAELQSVARDGRMVRHVRANVVIGQALPPREATRLRVQARSVNQSAERCYVDALFHGPELQGIRAVEGIGQEGIVGRVATAPAPGQWLRRPLRNNWLADPLAIDCAFQLMVLWGLEQHGLRSLPTALARYRQFVRAFPRDEVQVVAQVTRDLGQRVVASVEFVDGQGNLVARIDGYECILDRNLDRAYARRRLDVPLARRASEGEVVR